MADLVDRAVASYLGAAVGDALGWPQENRSSNMDRQVPAPSIAFRTWHRRGGNRFNAYEEPVLAGEYSDDTQMICAISRKLNKGPSWYEWLVRVELPAFPIYQRGAGRAVLRACRSWLAGVCPWEAQKGTDSTAYFNAGGNGGAMRVLPHAVLAASSDRSVNREDVVRNVTTTH